jgi:hypothetical protein
MARGATKVEDPAAPGEGSDAPKTSKRRCVQSACVPCRKRKSKVSAQRRCGPDPSCRVLLSAPRTERPMSWPAQHPHATSILICLRSPKCGMPTDDSLTHKCDIVRRRHPQVRNMCRRIQNRMFLRRGLRIAPHHQRPHSREAHAALCFLGRE